MKKIGFSIVVLVSVIIIVYFFNSSIWNDFYYTDIVPRAKDDNTLAPIVTSITGLIALASFGISWRVFAQNKWKPSLALNFYVLHRGILKEIKLGKHPKRLRRSSLDSGQHLSFSTHQSRNEIPMFSGSSHLENDKGISSYPLYVDIVSTEVRNIGRSTLRFKIPNLVSKDRKTDLDIIPVEIRKNGVSLEYKNGMYISLDTGEVAEFFYSFDKIVDYLKQPRTYDISKLKNKKSVILSHLVHRLSRRNKLIAVLLKPYILIHYFSPRSNHNTRLLFSIVDNTGQRKVMDRQNYWVLDEYQTRIFNGRSFRALLTEEKENKLRYQQGLEKENGKDSEKKDDFMERFFLRSLEQSHLVYDFHKRTMQINFVMQIVFQSLQTYFDQKEQRQSLKDLNLWAVLISDFLVTEHILWIHPKNGGLYLDRKNFKKYKVSSLVKIVSSENNKSSFPYPHEFFDRFHNVLDMLPFE